MRDIKFRGKIKNPKVNKWVYGYLVDECHINEKNQLGYTPIRKETLGQYTGLKDKNGKEIYEGDIIHINDKLLDEFNYLIVWDEEYLRYYLISIDKKNLNRLGGILEAHLNSLEIEIIGNKWDNPELLEEGE